MILILLIIAGVIVGYLGFKPNKPYTRYAMMDGNVDGFGVLRLNSEDQGVSEFTTFLFRRLEKSTQAGDPAQAKVMSGVLKVSRNFLTTVVQPETMLYTSYDPESADENVVMAVPLKNQIAAAGVRQFIQKYIVETPIDKYEDAEIYQLSAGDGTGTATLLALDSREAVVSDHQTFLSRSLKYSKDATRAAVPSEQLQVFIDELALDEPPPGEDLAVALVNEESRITNLIFVFEDWVNIAGISNQIAAALASQNLTFADITGIKLTADLASADQLNGELTLYSPSTETATRLAKVFEGALTSLAGPRPGTPFQLAGNARARGATVVVALQLTGLKAWIESLLPVDEAAVAAGVAQPAEATPVPAVTVNPAAE